MRPTVAVRAGGGRRGERAIRARVARAASGERHPRAVDSDEVEQRYPVRRATTRRCSKAGVSTTSRRSPVLVGRGPPDPRGARGDQTGDGVPYADYGEDLHEGQAPSPGRVRATCSRKEWLPAVPDHPRSPLSAIRPREWPIVAAGRALEHRDRRAYPKALRSTGSTSTGVDRAARATSKGAGLRTA